MLNYICYQHVEILFLIHEEVVLSLKIKFACGHCDISKSMHLPNSQASVNVGYHWNGLFSVHLRYIIGATTTNITDTF